MSVSNGAWRSTCDIAVTNLEGADFQAVYADDEHRDGRAIWSPDGERIAWHHAFTRGVDGNPEHYGVGIAHPNQQGEWTAELPPEQDAFVTPLAWSPDSRYLLCADPSRTTALSCS